MWLLIANLGTLSEATLKWIKDIYTQQRPTQVFLLEFEPPGDLMSTGVQSLLDHILAADWHCTVHSNNDLDLHPRVVSYKEISHVSIDGHSVLVIPQGTDRTEVTRYLDELDHDVSSMIVFGPNLPSEIFDPFGYAFLGGSPGHAVLGAKMNIVHVGSPMKSSDTNHPLSNSENGVVLYNPTIGTWTHLINPHDHFAIDLLAEKFIDVQPNMDDRTMMLAYIQHLTHRSFSDRPAQAQVDCDLTELSKLTMDNFMGVCTLTFNFGDWRRGICLIEGRTGSGKSTIMKALHWAVYGTLLHGMEETEIDVVNTKNKRCLVRVTFGDGCVLTRTVEPCGRIKSSLVVTDASGTTCTDQNLWDIIRAKRELVSRIIISFRQIHKIMMATPKKRQATYRRLLGFSILDDYLREIVRDKVQAKRNHSETCKEHEQAVSTARSLRDQLELILGRQCKRKDGLDQLATKQQGLKEEQLACEQVIQASKSNLDSLLTRRHQLQKELTHLTNNERESRTNMQDADQAVDSFVRSTKSAQTLSLHASLDRCNTEWREAIENRNRIECDILRLQFQRTQAENERERNRSQLEELDEQRKSNMRIIGEHSVKLSKIHKLQEDINAIKRQMSQLFKTERVLEIERHQHTIRESLGAILTSIQDEMRHVHQVISRRWLGRIYMPLRLIAPGRPFDETRWHETQASIRQKKDAILSVIQEVRETQREATMLVTTLGLTDRELVTKSKHAEYTMMELDARILTVDAEIRSLSADLDFWKHKLEQVTADESRLRQELEQPTNPAFQNETLLQLQCMKAFAKTHKDHHILSVSEFMKNQRDLEETETMVTKQTTYLHRQQRRLDEIKETVITLTTVIAHSRETIDKEDARMVKTKHEIELNESHVTELAAAVKQCVRALHIIEQWHAMWTQSGSGSSSASATSPGSFTSFCLEQTTASVNARLRETMTLFSQDAVNDLSCMLDVKSLELVEIGDGLPMPQRSSGQRLQSYLALLLSMFECATPRPNLLFLDDIFDLLDTNGRTALQKWTTGYTLAHRKSLIFVATFGEVLVDMVCTLCI